MTDRPKIVIDVNKHGIRREMPAGGYRKKKRGKNEKLSNKINKEDKGKV